MNRLVLVPCVVVASYVALASYLVWPSIVYEHGGSRAALKIPTSVANRGEIRKDGSSPTEQTSPVLAAYEAPTKPAAPTAKSATAVLPESHELTWVTVLLPARVHTGPSVDTPISHFYAVGTPLHARRYWNDWIEVIEPGASKSGWIYRKYLGAISNSEQTKIASQEVQAQNAVAQSVPAKRYAKASPAKRYASTIRSSKQSTRVKQVTAKPIRSRTEMASLLQRAFSGY
jgi:hypothetical protein